ncbi:MAG: lysophospholipid acyltransferase family protein [Wenzhouxiangellaceae bacterium]|nr:lysophospholipid acyltransferase family protein [Wenzhouxiangellaceae bacterium]
MASRPAPASNRSDPAPSASRWWWRVYPLWQWLVLIPAAVLVTILGWFFTVLVSLAGRPDIANTQVAARWARVIAWLTPMPVEVLGREHIQPGQSYVVVANHLSQYDIPLVYGYSGLDLRWVIKAELGRIPFVAHGCRAIGHIFIERGNPEQARQAINDAVARLQPGTGVLFFAEGTRSRSGELMPFRKGAFRVAADRGLPVLPVTVLGTWQILRPGSLKIRPGPARLVFHAPIEPVRGSADEAATDLSRRTHAVIASELAKAGPAGAVR